MAVAVVDDDSGHGTTGNGASATWTHLNDSSADYLVAGGVWGSGTTSIDTCTYNAISMTRIGSQVTQQSVVVTLFEKTDPSAGSNDVVMTADASSRFAVASAGFTGVDGTTPQDGLNSSNAQNDADPESDLTFSTSDDDMMFTFFGHQHGGLTLSENASQQTEYQGSPRSSGASPAHVQQGNGYRDTTGSATVGWDLSASNHWVHLAININAAEAVAGSLIWARHDMNTLLLR